MACRGLMVCGTGTDVGKTYVSCVILDALWRAGSVVGAYKPVCSGVVEAAGAEPFWSDARLLSQACGGRFAEHDIAPQCFRAPLSPPRSARREGRVVEEALILQGLQRWQTAVDYLLIETAGGFMSPLSERWTMADFAVEVGYPLLIIARLELGVINQVLLTVEAAERRGLTVAGLVFNAMAVSDPLAVFDDLAEDLLPRLTVPILGIMPPRGAVLLTPQGEEIAFDWTNLFDFSSSDR